VVASSSGLEVVESAQSTELLEPAVVAAGVDCSQSPAEVGRTLLEQTKLKPLDHVSGNSGVSTFKVPECPSKLTRVTEDVIIQNMLSMEHRFPNVVSISLPENFHLATISNSVADLLEIKNGPMRILLPIALIRYSKTSNKRLPSGNLDSSV
jgi:hypothetical protein